ncbi:MAG: hypothetical protein V7K86_23325 [Nostoc sp.]|uniref:hypothetical protein n=1 Tax=Nostoc sp. TaxID=1180 RepID=UPI002FFC1DB7
MRTIDPEIDEQVVSSGWTTAIAILMILHCLVDFTGIDPGFESGGMFGLYPSSAGFSQSLYDETLQLEIEQAKA